VESGLIERAAKNAGYEVSILRSAGILPKDIGAVMATMASPISVNVVDVAAVMVDSGITVTEKQTLSNTDIVNMGKTLRAKRKA
jgi:anaerobic C4-dicarboxylate transporter